jgi:hypothetical protein
MSDLMKNIHGDDDDRKEFTEQGLAKLVELLTQGAVEIVNEGDEIVLRPDMKGGCSEEAMKVKLANVIAATVDQVGQSAADDAHRAYCELYGLAGLLREGAELAEATARAIEPYRWRDTKTPQFIRWEDQFADWHIPKDDEGRENDE